MYIPIQYFLTLMFYNTKHVTEMCNTLRHTHIFEHTCCVLFERGENGSYEMKYLYINGAVY